MGKVVNSAAYTYYSHNSHHFAPILSPGEANGIVIVALGIGGYVDTERFPNACEVQRGLSDVYGQLGGRGYQFHS